MTWCACRVFSFLFLFCSFLVNFTNLRWKEFNIILIISIYWVELYYYLHCFFLFMFFVFFLFGSWGGCGGCISIHEKDRGLRQHTINYVYVLVYYILFFHFFQLRLLSLNVMCCGLQLVLWFHLLALLNLGSRLQGFIWRSADKVPAWKSEQLLIPCNWWHPLGACWWACKTKPLQTGVKCSSFLLLLFLQNKSCLKLSLFCMRTDDWLNFHVKFQSIHVNITSTAHHFFFFPPFFLLHISKTCQKKKKKLVKLKTNAYTHVMCTNTLKKIHFLQAFNSFQPEWFFPLFFFFI